MRSIQRDARLKRQRLKEIVYAPRVTKPAAETEQGFVAEEVLLRLRQIELGVRIVRPLCFMPCIARHAKLFIGNEGGVGQYARPC